jgi:hypothetical protein
MSLERVRFERSDFGRRKNTWQVGSIAGDIIDEVVGSP